MGLISFVKKLLFGRKEVCTKTPEAQIVETESVMVKTSTEENFATPIKEGVIKSNLKEDIQVKTNLVSEKPVSEKVEKTVKEIKSKVKPSEKTTEKVNKPTKKSYPNKNGRKPKKDNKRPDANKGN